MRKTEDNITDNREEEEKIGYRQILTQKEYCKIIFANLISRFGDSIDAIAFTWLVYAVTGSASWTAVIGALNMLPTILLQPFAGPAVERRNKKLVMVISDVIRGLVVAALALCYVTNQMNPWIMAVFTLTISSVEAFCMPASTAIIPQILDRKYYAYGMSLNTIGSTVMELAGAGVAGVIIGVFGVEAAILIDAVTFFISALVTMCVRTGDWQTEAKTTKTSNTYLEDLKGGFQYVKGKKSVWNLCLLAFLTNAMVVPINSFQAPLVSDVLGQGSGLLSAIGIAVVCGMGVGSFLFPHMSERYTVRNLVFLSGIGISVFMGIIPVGSLFRERTFLVYAVTSAAFFVVSLCASILSALLGVQFIKCVEEAYLARAKAIFGAGSVAAIPLVSFALSIVVKFVPVKNLIIASSVICVIIFIMIRISKVEFEEADEGENCVLQSD